ncbi:MAG: hypothetical protein ACUVRH_04680 [Candidatus Bipolaricaulia bacterium]
MRLNLEQLRLPPRPEAPDSALFARSDWARYSGLAAFVGAITILVLPQPRRIGELIGASWTPSPFFAGALLVAFGAFALTVGQRGERWQSRLQAQADLWLWRYLARLALQLAFGLFVLAPFFLVFKLITYLSPFATILSGTYLFGYGLVLGIGGLLLGTIPSESLQFQLKYLGLLAYLGGTLLEPAMSPFFNLKLLLEGGAYPVESIGGLLLLTALGGALLLLARRRLELWRGSRSSS